MKKAALFTIVATIILLVSIPAFAKGGHSRLNSTGEESLIETEQVKIFTAVVYPNDLSNETARLQKEINAWLQKNREEIEVTERVMSMSAYPSKHSINDAEALLTITIFYKIRLK